MRAIEVENELREVVSRLITEVDLSTKQGRQDINLISEDAWIPILKEVFQCPNLVNLNKKQKNFPGIDLGDEQDRVAFQITASTDLQKIKKTLSQFRDKNYKNSFDELYIFTITNKQNSYSQDAIDNIVQGNFSFCARKNIIDPGDVLQRITSLRLGAQERLLNEFKVILGDIKDRITEFERADEVPLLLVSNLLKVKYPEYVFIAELDLDESLIIEMAKKHINYKKNKASKATLVRLMLVMSEKPQHGWVVHENKIFTFSNLNIVSDFNSFIDTGSVERINSDYFIHNDLTEYRSLFNWLLKDTVKDILEPYHVNYQKDENVFYFMPHNQSDTQRKEIWIGQKKATRTVYEAKYQTKDPSKIAYHKHLSFELTFLHLEDGCYAVIVPNWFYTFNLYRKNLFHQDLLSNQKRLEFNQSVRNHVLFLAYFLSSLNSNTNPELRFLNLVELECSCALSLSDELQSVDLEQQRDSYES